MGGCQTAGIQMVWGLPSKQDVAGSIPAARSDRMIIEASARIPAKTLVASGRVTGANEFPCFGLPQMIWGRVLHNHYQFLCACWVTGAPCPDRYGGETMKWEDIEKLDEGTILQRGSKKGIKYVLMRGVLAIHAYIRIPDNSMFSGSALNAIPLDVHGGLTSEHNNTSKLLGEGRWVGWDYGHLYDATFIDKRDPENMKVYKRWYNDHLHKWIDDDVLLEVFDICEQLLKLIKDSEKPMERIVKGKDNVD